MDHQAKTAADTIDLPPSGQSQSLESAEPRPPSNTLFGQGKPPSPFEGHPAAERMHKALKRAGFDQIDEKLIELINKYCHQCQLHGTALGRFKFTLKDDVDFNHSFRDNQSRINRNTLRNIATGVDKIAGGGNNIVDSIKEVAGSITQANATNAAITALSDDLRSLRDEVRGLQAELEVS
ncbi:hypothetical protein GGR54DRAFT_641766 [Hypoxylon sp. NC1633]|nr:hypothetical protein GGR54DRAFT_641766 [Hypoxylon sp. NC1633]